MADIRQPRSCWRCRCTENHACRGGCTWVGPLLCSACCITLELAETWTVRHAVHLDGPRGRKGWFGDIHTCIQEPRLQRMTRYYRATRSVVRSWMVDGQEIVGGLYCAIERLNTPPVITREEFSALARAPGAFTDLRKTADLPALMTLSDKGLIEFRAGKCRRTGARALTPNGDLI